MNHIVGRFRIIRSRGQLLVSLDGETRSLLTEFAEHSRITLDEAAMRWLELQVVALCCLEYSDREIAAMLDVAYGTTRTHLYNAIRKLGIRKKSELLFLLRNWDFSKFDKAF